MVPEGWHELALEKVVSTSITYGVVQPGEADDGGVPFVRGGDFPNGRVLIDRLRTISPAISAAYKRTVLRGDELLVSLVGYPGATAIVPNALIGANIARQAALVRPNNAADRVYLFHFLSSQIGQKRMLAKSLGSAQQVINLRDLKEVAVLLPPLPEQKKIAEILSTWDKAIETTEKLLANAEAQKRALMQKLLTGKHRLKGFEGAWHVASLGELGETYGGLTGKSKEDFGSGAPYITYMMVFGSSSIDMRQVDHVAVDAKERQHRVRKGDIFFTTSSETPNEVGMSSVLLEEPGQCYLNSFCFGYRLHKAGSLIPEFARHLLRGPTFRRDIRKLAQGATRYNLSKRELMKLEMKLPPVEEQRKIAAVLDNANDTVEGLNQQLARLDTEKRSLMQQLLTGKRRVKV